MKRKFHQTTSTETSYGSVKSCWELVYQFTECGFLFFSYHSMYNGFTYSYIWNHPFVLPKRWLTIIFRLVLAIRYVAFRNLWNISRNPGVHCWNFWFWITQRSPKLYWNWMFYLCVLFVSCGNCIFLSCNGVSLFCDWFYLYVVELKSILTQSVCNRLANGIHLHMEKS